MALLVLSFLRPGSAWRHESFWVGSPSGDSSTVNVAATFESEIWWSQPMVVWKDAHALPAQLFLQDNWQCFYIFVGRMLVSFTTRNICHVCWFAPATLAKAKCSCRLGGAFGSNNLRPGWPAWGIAFEKAAVQESSGGCGTSRPGLMATAVRFIVLKKKL